MVVLELLVSYLSYTKNLINNDGYKPKLYQSIDNLFKGKYKLRTKDTKDINNFPCERNNKIYEIYTLGNFFEKRGMSYELQFTKPNLDTLISSSYSDDSFTILMIGGSELMGYSHLENRIHLLLQSKLQRYFKTSKITVVNAGNAGAFLKDELYIFNDLSAAIKFNMVIQHTGLNDAAYIGDILGDNNQILDYAYSKNLHGYAKQKDRLKIEIGKNGFVQEKGELIDCQKEYDMSEIKDIFLENFNWQLDNIIYKLNQTDISHIIGIQGFNESKSISNKSSPVMHLKHINKDIPGFINFNQFNSTYEWYDDSHTNKDTAILIADKYFEIIIKNFKEDINSSITYE